MIATKQSTATVVVAGLLLLLLQLELSSCQVDSSNTSESSIQHLPLSIKSNPVILKSSFNKIFKRQKWSKVLS